MKWFALVACLLMVACSTPSHQAFIVPDMPTHVTAVTIRADIDDRAIFCVEVTPAMTILDLIQGTKICDTVGSLRHRYAQLRSAN